MWMFLQHSDKMYCVAAATKGVTNGSSREKISPVKNFYPVKFVCGSGRHLNCVHIIRVKNYHPWITIPPWNLFCFPRDKLPAPDKLLLYTLFALLTRDLLVIAKICVIVIVASSSTVCTILAYHSNDVTVHVTEKYWMKRHTSKINLSESDISPERLYHSRFRFSKKADDERRSFLE